MKKLWVVLCLFCLSSNACVDPYERVRKKAMKMWSTLDILRAIHMSEHDKVKFSRLLAHDSLVLYSYLDSMCSAKGTYSQEDVLHLTSLCDYIGDVFSHAFCSSVSKYSVCFCVIMELVQDRLESLVAPGDVESRVDAGQGCLEYMFSR